MGIYSDYLSMNMQFDALTSERKKMLSRISALRGGRNIMVYAAAVTKRGDVAIDESDLIPFTDTVSSLDFSKGLDIILETPGGSAETVEKIVRHLRSKFSDIAVIVPRMAMSAGTIFAMAANDILMGEISSLGPIDAQVPFNGRYLPAAAILDGVKEIMDEVVKKNGKLNPAYIPILQNINPGVLKGYEKDYRIVFSVFNSRFLRVYRLRQRMRTCKIRQRFENRPFLRRKFEVQIKVRLRLFRNG